MDPMDRIADWLRKARRAVAFTGAGISTESGIPDFRSPGGVWAKHKPVLYDDFLHNHAERVRYWKMRDVLYRDFQRARPNAGHRALAELERLGHIVAVITQNIDGLHQDAGSKEVIELHGTNRVIACVLCGREWPPEEIMARWRQGDEAPACDTCGGPLKSKTISFGQPMPEKALARAYALSGEADVFLAMGSSLVVEPAASLPRFAKQRGAILVILNQTSTPLDPLADVVLHEKLGPALERLVARMVDRQPETS